MKLVYFISTITLAFMINIFVIYDFHSHSDLSNWRTVNDDVMGGISNSKIYLNNKGNAIFEGHVSLENNGGFAMVMYNFEQKDVSDYKKVVIKLKGDGKKYQFRVKTNSNDYYSYIAEFETNEDWQSIEIDLKTMYPAFRGRKLDKPNYPKLKAEQIAFLIGNKKDENFRLEIDKITFE